MNDKCYTKKQLLDELKTLRDRVAELEQLESDRKRSEEALRESQERYALTTSAGQVGIWDWKLETNEIYLDPNLKAMLGYEDHEIRNHFDDWGRFVHPDDVEQVMAKANAHLKGLTPQYEVTHRMLHKDGSIRWFLARGNAIRDANGKPYRVLGTDSDVTERKRTEEELKKHREHLEELVEERTAELRTANEQLAQEIAERKQAGGALRESEERFRYIADVSPFPISIIDSDGRYIYLNRRFIEVVGYTLEDIPSGKQWFEKAYPDAENRKRAISFWLSDLERSGKYEVRPREFRVTCKDGTLRDIVFRPVTMEGGKQFITYEDITERKHAEKQLRESEAKYRELVQNANSIILRFDIQGRISFFNEFAQSFFGYSEDEVLGQNVVGTIVPMTDASGQDLAAMIRDLLQHPEQYINNENENIRQNGERVWVAWTNKAVLDENGGIAEILSIGNDITTRRRAEEALRQSEERYRTLFEQANDAIFLAHEDDRIIDVNRRACELLGYTREELLKMKVPDVQAPEVRGQAGSVIKEELAKYGGRVFEGLDIHRDGTRIAVEVSTRRLMRGGLVLSIVRDITERKRLEEQLLWSQKMETVGRLAGGVAHEFNNLLAIIQGNTELAMMEPYPGDRIKNDLQEILKASNRGAKLTQQLLAFSRRQIMEPKVVNLNEVLADTDKMLSRLIGEDIEFVTLRADGLGQVKIDPNQAEQVLVNLVINARDAMPDGGKLTIETANVTLDNEYARQHPGACPGEYVMLAVGDTGVGITEEVRAHLFEPFFTTKTGGKGTGLGLAMCYGIVKQSAGYIWANSEPGKGTTFKIYLPRVEEEAGALPKHDEEGYLPRGTEVVLLVEDEPSLRNVVARTLRDQGYSVVEADNGQEALQLFRKQAGKDIHLLLTDVVMPQMGGKTLAERLWVSHPDLKVIFFSGHPGEVICHQGLLNPGIVFLQKPFSPAVLARKVREVLDG